MRRLKRKRPKDHFLLKLCAAAVLCLLLSIWLKNRFIFLCALMLWVIVLFAVIFTFFRTLADRMRMPHIFGFWVPLIVWACCISLLTLFMNYTLGPRVWCRTNLGSLGKAIRLYADEHNDTYPAYDKWCDLLLEEGTATEKDFRCPVGKKNKCHYAINPNCEPNSPPDRVLLFETKEGWNQFGGPEILFPRHFKNILCNVLFNDGKVGSIRPNELDKLRWGEKQNTRGF